MDGVIFFYSLIAATNDIMTVSVCGTVLRYTYGTYYYSAERRGAAPMQYRREKSQVNQKSPSLAGARLK